MTEDEKTKVALEIAGFLLDRMCDELGDVDSLELQDLMACEPFVVWKVAPEDEKEYDRWYDDNPGIGGDVGPGDSYWELTPFGQDLLQTYRKNRRAKRGH